MGSEIERVAVVGAGVIGSGWAARFLGAGLDVAAWEGDRSTTSERSANYFFLTFCVSAEAATDLASLLAFGS